MNSNASGAGKHERGFLDEIPDEIEMDKAVMWALICHVVLRCDSRTTEHDLKKVVLITPLAMGTLWAWQGRRAPVSRGTSRESDQ